MDFKVGSLYTFDTIAPAILGQTYESARLTAVVDYSIAVGMDNIDYRHASVKAYLGAGIPTDPTQYQFLRFQTQAGSAIVLASVWIAEATIVETQTQKVTLVVEGANLDDALKMKSILGLAGYKRVTISS